MSVFDFNGEKYKQASNHQKKWGNDLISKLVLSGNETILDLGCGDGMLTMQLANFTRGKVIGIDASKGMIETAKRSYSKDNLEFKLMDIDNLDFIDQFDLIYSNAALHWVKDHQRLFQNCYQALKTNGKLAWNFTGEGTTLNFVAVIKEVISLDQYQKYFQNFTWPWYMPALKEYQRLIETFEFKDLNLTFENRDRYFTNDDELIKWIDQPCLVPFINQIPVSKKELFRQKVIDLMLVRTRQDDGTYFETFKRINLLATKR